MIRRIIARLRTIFGPRRCQYGQVGCAGRDLCPFCERDLVNGEFNP